MTKAYIEEFSELMVDAAGRLIQAPDQAKLITTQVVDYTAGEAKSAAFDPKTRFISIQNDSIMSRTFGADPTATTASPRRSADTLEYVGVAPGQKVSCVTNS